MIYTLSRICAIEWKCSFCALKPFKTHYMEYTFKYSNFSKKYVGTTYLDIFHMLALSQVYGKQ